MLYEVITRLEEHSGIVFVDRAGRFRVHFADRQAKRRDGRTEIRAAVESADVTQVAVGEEITIGRPQAIAFQEGRHCENRRGTGFCAPGRIQGLLILVMPAGGQITGADRQPFLVLFLV